MEHKQSLEQSRRDVERLYETVFEEKDTAMGILRNKMLAISAEGKHKVEAALSQQQKELLEIQSSQCDQLRVEKQQMETKHQVELSRLLQHHLQDIAQQRKQLEGAHQKLLEDMSEELRTANNRYSEALTAAASKHSESTQAMEEQRARFEELLSSSKQELIREKDAQIAAEKSSLRKSMEADAQRFREEAEQREARIQQECDELLEKTKQEHIRKVETLTAGLSAEHTISLDKTSASMREAHKRQVEELQSQYSIEADRLQERILSLEGELDQTTASVERAELEGRKSLGEQKALHEGVVRDLRDAMREQQIELERRHAEELHAAEAAFSEQLSSVQTKVAGEAARERSEIQEEKQAQQALLDKARNDMEQTMRIQGEEHIRQMEALRAKLGQETAEHIQQSAWITAQWQELQARHAALLDKLHTVERQFELEKELLRSQNDELLRTRSENDKLDSSRVVSELKEAHTKAVRTLQEIVDRQAEELRQQQDSIDTDTVASDTRMRDLESNHRASMKAMEKQQVQLQSERRELLEEQARLHEEMGQLESALQGARHEYEALRRDRQLSSKEEAQLRSELDAAVKGKSALQTQLQRISETLQQGRAELDSSFNEVQSLEDALRIQSEATQALQNKYNTDVQKLRTRSAEDLAGGMRERDAAQDEKQMVLLEIDHMKEEYRVVTEAHIRELAQLKEAYEHRLRDLEQEHVEEGLKWEQKVQQVVENGLQSQKDTDVAHKRRIEQLAFEMEEIRRETREVVHQTQETADEHVRQAMAQWREDLDRDVYEVRVEGQEEKERAVKEREAELGREIQILQDLLRNEKEERQKEADRVREAEKEREVMRALSTERDMERAAERLAASSAHADQLTLLREEHKRGKEEHKRDVEGMLKAQETIRTEALLQQREEQQRDREQDARERDRQSQAQLSEAAQRIQSVEYENKTLLSTLKEAEQGLHAYEVQCNQLSERLEECEQINSGLRQRMVLEIDAQAAVSQVRLDQSLTETAVELKKTHIQEVERIRQECKDMLQAVEEQKKQLFTEQTYTEREHDARIRGLEEKIDAGRELQRLLQRAEAQKEAYKKEVEALKDDRNTLLDDINKLEIKMEVEDIKKESMSAAKIDSLLISEKVQCGYNGNIKGICIYMYIVKDI